MYLIWKHVRFYQSIFLAGLKSDFIKTWHRWDCSERDNRIRSRYEKRSNIIFHCGLNFLLPWQPERWHRRIFESTHRWLVVGRRWRNKDYMEGLLKKSMTLIGFFKYKFKGLLLLSGNVIFMSSSPVKDFAFPTLLQRKPFAFVVLMLVDICLHCIRNNIVVPNAIFIYTRQQ